MKITITSYEGQPEFSSYTAEVNDDVNENQFLDALERVVQGFFPGLILEARREEPEDSGHSDPGS